MAKAGRKWIETNWTKYDECLRAQDIPYDEDESVKQRLDYLDNKSAPTTLTVSKPSTGQSYQNITQIKFLDSSISSDSTGLVEISNQRQINCKTFTRTTFIQSGVYWYTDVQHDFDTTEPLIVDVFDIDGFSILSYNVELLNRNVARIWFGENKDTVKIIVSSKIPDSASVFTKTSFIESGGYWYTDCVHNFATSEPLFVRIYDSTTRLSVESYNAQLLDADTVRIWLSTLKSSIDVIVMRSGAPYDDSEDILVTDRTINILSSYSRTDIQNLIDNQPKHLKAILTFQFADATYSMSDKLDFKGFFGNGKLVINGNALEDGSLHTNQSVHLNFSTTNCNGFNLKDVSCECILQNIKVTINTDTTSNIGVYCIRSNPQIKGCYFVGSDTANGIGIYAETSMASITNNYITKFYYGIRSSIGTTFSENNSYSTTRPVYGLFAENASTIGKSSTQPEGSTSNETSVRGGTIR
jgi:hypothetical protein